MHAIAWRRPVPSSLHSLHIPRHPFVSGRDSNVEWILLTDARPCPHGFPSHFVGCVLELLGIVDEKYFQGLLGEAKDLTNLTAICFPKMEAVEGTIFRCIPKSVSRFTYSSSLSLRQTWRHTVRNPIGPDDLIAASRKSSSMGAERYHTCHCTMI